MKSPSSFISQTGSALFIVLICVVLFAALSYTVAQMFRGGSPNAIGEEKAKLQADEILNYARSLRQAAQNLKISNACADSDISLENPAIAGYEHAPVVADTCKMFNNKGGGLVYLKPSTDWLDMLYTPPPAMRGDWYFPANVCVPGVGTAPADATCNTDGINNEAIIVVLPYVRLEVCEALNDSLGVTNPGGTPPQETGNAWLVTNDKYIGVNTDGERIDQTGQQAGCFEGAAGSTPNAKTYHFFQVLVPR